MLRLDALRKDFGPVRALDGVGFSVPAGEVVGFLGPNGAGKTTTMRAILGLVAMDGGSITWDGVEVGAAERTRFGYMPEERGLYPRMRVLDQIVYFARLAGVSRPDATRAGSMWLERLGLADRARDEVSSLSHGNQQRVQLAVALVHEPKLLVLDEPFSGLDPLGVDAMKALLAEQAERGVAVLFSSHQLDLVADICRDVVIVDHGRVVLDGEVEQLRSSAPIRSLDVSFAAPVPPGWAAPLPGARPGPAVVAPGTATTDGPPAARHRLVVDASADPAQALRAAEATGVAVERFAFEPPDLSEVFRGAVGRTVDEIEAAAEDHQRAAHGVDEPVLSGPRGAHRA